MCPERSVTYVSGPDLKELAGATGLEPATSCVTGRRSNQLNYAPAHIDLTNGGQCRARTCDLLLVRQAL